MCPLKAAQTQAREYSAEKTNKTVTPGQQLTKPTSSHISTQSTSQLLVLFSVFFEELIV